MTASATITSGGAGAPPTEAMKACRLGSAKNCWKCSALSHSSWTRTKPSPIPKRWWIAPADREASVELAYFGGLSCREAAQAAGIAEGTAKSRLRLAYAKLKTVLDASLLESP